MKTFLKRLAVLLMLLAVLTLIAAVGWLATKRVQREGTLSLDGLSAAVDVRYDEYGVPHISAANETDLYRALGYVHAQDRLFRWRSRGAWRAVNWLR